MKILYVNKFFFPKGGAETVMFQERAFMQEQGAEILDFSMHDECNLPSSCAEYFVRSVSYKKGPLKERLRAALTFVHSAEAVRKISALVERYRPDIAHLHNIYHQLTPSIIPAPKKKGVKVVLTLHDGKLVCPAYLMLNQGQPCLDCNGSRFYLPLLKNCHGSRLRGALLTTEAYYHKWRKSYEQVDAIISPSRFLSGLVSGRVAAEKLHIIPNGIDTKKYTPTWEDENYLLFLGRLSKEKGLCTLLRAHAAMPDAPRLVIVGTGPLEEELRREASPTVTFTGYCHGDALWSHIRKASALVVPSECYENAPMTILEAMAMGKPVIASRMGGVPEQLEDGVNGFLCTAGQAGEFSQAMHKVMASPELRGKIGRAARARTERDFSLDAHNRRLLDLYNSL